MLKPNFEEADGLGIRRDVIRILHEIVVYLGVGYVE